MSIAQEALPISAPKRKVEALSERALLNLLRLRHVRGGNGGNGEYAFLEHVRDEAAFSGSRTLDALTVSLWPSRGLALHGYEIKSSRSDWLRELHNPDKADGFIERCDYFSLVVGERDIVALGELPSTWGLLVPRGGKLVTEVAAPKLPRTKAQQMISRSWLVCLLRAAGTVPETDPADIRAAREQGIAEGKATNEHLLHAARGQLADERKRLDAEQDARMEILGALGEHSHPWNAPGASQADRAGSSRRAGGCA